MSERRKGLSVAAVIRDAEGRVLLVKQTYGRLNWELPGGSVDLGESLVDAVLREVREETGLEAVADRVTGLYDERDIDFLHVVFACHRTDPLATPTIDLAEVSACAFWSVEALPRPMSDYTVRRIHDAMSGAAWPLPHVLRERRWSE